ncbi:MAG: metal ABC transporter permease [Thermomicrobiales bacterium]
MFDRLMDPFASEFFQNALFSSTLIGGLCGLIGVFVILRRMSYIGHGLAHSVFGGAVVSFVLELDFYLGAGLWGLLSVVIINQIARRRHVDVDSAIGIVTTASFAIGVAIVSHQRSFTQNFESSLFGNILGITTQDLVAASVVAIIVFMTYSPELAQAHGVNTRAIDTFYALALAMTVVVSINIVGVTLIAAAIVIPPATARLVARSFGKLTLLSSLLGAFYGFAGVYVSYWINIASGPAVVLIAASGFFVTAGSQSLLVRLRPRTQAERSPVPSIVPSRGKL